MNGLVSIGVPYKCSTNVAFIFPIFKSLRVEHTVECLSKIISVLVTFFHYLDFSTHCTIAKSKFEIYHQSAHGTATCLIGSKIPAQQSENWDFGQKLLSLIFNIPMFLSLCGCSILVSLQNSNSRFCIQFCERYEWFSVFFVARTPLFLLERL